MITKQKILNELKLFLNELKKSNEQLDREAAEKRSAIRCQYYLDNPDELKPYGDVAEVVASATTSSHMFYSKGALKFLKNMMWAQVVLVLSLPILFPLVAWNIDRQTISHQTEWNQSQTQQKY